MAAASEPGHADPRGPFVISSPETMIAVGAAVAQSLEGGAVVALDGELGAGKSVFVRGMAEGMGIDPAQVSSPTFVLVQRYRGDRLDLVHADAYRLRGAHEIEATGWSEAAGAPDCLAVIEWASRAPSAVPAGAIRISIAHASPREESSTRRDPGHSGDARLREVTVIDPDPIRLARVVRAVEEAIEHGARGAACPICGRPVAPGAEQSPFCSARCRSADLGRWLGERYRVSRPLGADDLEER